jgi:hypothetical protein
MAQKVSAQSDEWFIIMVFKICHFFKYHYNTAVFCKKGVSENFLLLRYWYQNDLNLLHKICIGLEFIIKLVNVLLCI